jgi:hypothetical protein
MKSHVVDSQRLEYISNVDLGPAGNIKMNMWEPQVDKFLHNDEDLFSRRRASGGIGALVKGVYDDIESPLPWVFEHGLQAFQECILAGLAEAAIMILKKVRENFGELVRLDTNLDEDGRQQVADVLFVVIPEIKVEKGNHGQPCLTYVVDLFND